MRHSSTEPTTDQWKELDADALRHQHDAAEHTTPQWQSNTGRLPFASVGDDESIPKKSEKGD